MSITNVRQGVHQVMTVESLTACKNQLQYIKFLLQNCHHWGEVRLRLEEMSQEEESRDVINLTDSGLNSNENEIASIMQCISDITSEIYLLLDHELKPWEGKVREMERKTYTYSPTTIEIYGGADRAVHDIGYILENSWLMRGYRSELDDCKSVNSHIATLLTDRLQGRVACAILEPRVHEIEKLSSLILDLKMRLVSCDIKFNRELSTTIDL